MGRSMQQVVVASRKRVALGTAFVLLSLALTFGLAAPAPAEVSFGPKISASLVAAATKQGVTSSTPLNAIVFGSDLAGANAHLGSLISVRQALGKIGGESVTIPAGSLAQLAAEDGVDFATLDPVVVTTSVSRPPLDGASLAANYPAIDGAVELWRQGFDGKGVSVAVVDSGVTKVADFSNDDRVAQDKLKGQKDSGGALNDPYGHGTFVAGIVGGYALDGSYVGIAPKADIRAINVSRPDGVRSSDVMAALLWVLANKDSKHIKVVNLSLTETVASSYLDSPLDAVVERLWRAGVVVVVSSGNKGPGEISYAPANDPFVITVGATDTNGTVSVADDTVAAFSSFGTTRDGVVKPELLAPGRRIESVLAPGTVLDGQAPASARLGGGYARMSGTSFSAPQVSGAVALLRQARPDLTPDQVKAILVATAAPIAGSTAGTLDVDAALDAPVAAGATQNYQQAQFSAPPPPAAVTAPPQPQTPDPAVAIAAAPVKPVVKQVAPSVANINDPLCKSCVSALQAEASANGLPASSSPSTVASAWEKAASAWEGAPHWSRAAAAWDKAAAAWERASTFDKGSSDRTKAYVDWERAAAWSGESSWGDAARSQEAAAFDLEQRSSLDKAAVAWDGASADWAGAGNAAAIAAAAMHGAAAWERFAAAKQVSVAANPSAGGWDAAAAAWYSAAADAAIAGADDVAGPDFNKAAAAYDAAVKLYKSAGKTDKVVADSNLAALAYGASAIRFERAVAWNDSAVAWDKAAADWKTVAEDSDKAAGVVQASANSNPSIANLVKAARAWEASTVNWRNQAAASQHSALGYDKAVAWNASGAACENTAAAWNKNAAAWDKAAAAWDKAGDGTSAAAGNAEANESRASSAASSEQAGVAWYRAAAWNDSAKAFAAAAATWEKAAAWNESGAAWAKSATAWDKAAAWNDGATAWEKSAAAWDKAAAWNTSAAFDRAVAWNNSATAWDNAANDWSNAMKLDDCAVALDQAGNAWARAGEWDKAAFDWSLAASRDPLVDWNVPSTAIAAWQLDPNAWD